MEWRTENAMTEKIHVDTCLTCGACCRYIASEIDRPTAKQDYDNIRWYLLHEGVHVFVDHDRSWYVEVEKRCSYLGTDNRCTNYGERPMICRRHGAGETGCEQRSDEDPFLVRFSTVDEFDAYLDDRGIEWRWKRLP